MVIGDLALHEAGKSDLGLVLARDLVHDTDTAWEVPDLDLKISKVCQK